MWPDNCNSQNTFLGCHQTLCVQGKGFACHSSVGLSIQVGCQTASPLGDAVGGLPSVGPVMHNGRAVGKHGNQVWIK